MGKPAARLTDMHTCPLVSGVVPHVGGPILPICAPTVITGSMPQARISDMAFCVGPPDLIVTGAFTVFVSGSPAARMGDQTAHGGVIVTGFPTVLIGDASSSAAAAALAGVIPMLGLEGGNADTIKMIKAMIAAAREGKPFCEQCMLAGR